ncbi:hypothetical protein BHMPCIPO_01929 [Ensifer sesbaniae]|nr:hypothetical protein [Ensifer sesbaniae]
MMRYDVFVGGEDGRSSFHARAVGKWVSGTRFAVIMSHSMSRGFAVASWKCLARKGIPLQHDATWKQTNPRFTTTAAY